MVRPEPRRQRLEARALDQGRGDDDEEDDRELFLAAGDPGDDREGREPDRGRAAQPGPAQHQSLAHVQRRQRGGGEGRQRARDQDQDGGERQPLQRHVVELAGEDEQAEEDEERQLGDPAEPLVEGDDGPAGGDVGAAQRQSGQVGGEQAGAVGDLGEAVGEGGDRDRRHRVDPVGRQPHPAQRRHREPADQVADADPDRDFDRQQAGHVGEPEAGLLDPFDEADHQQQGDRVVHPGLALERARQPLLQGRAAQHGEDRGRVGGGDRGADDHPFQGADVEDQLRREAGDHGGEDGADRRQRGRRAQHRPDLRPAGGQPALEEDQDQRDRAQRPRQLHVGELDAADPLRAGQHPEGEEEQQARDPDPVGQQRAEDARAQQGTGDQDQLGVMGPIDGP